MSATVERRAVTRTVELRGEPGQQRIGGYAIAYGKRSKNLGGFVEVVQPGFVAKSLADGVDVLARYQHDSNMLLGRVASGTLRLADDETGLDYEADVPDTTYGRDLAVLAGRGDVTSSSFAFRTMPDGDDWGLTENGFPLRTLLRGGGALIDVAPVVSPAYPDATAGLRSLAEHRGLDLDTVAKAAEANELGELLRAKEPTVIDLGGGGQGDTHPPIALRRRRLDLMSRRATS